MSQDRETSLTRAAELIEAADGLLVTAGAGMGIDSGLPDFRGPGGFWRVYPALESLGLNFMDVASPAAFDSLPRAAWGFYGDRLGLYRQTVPHEGFRILQRLAASKPHGLRVFTSNVDGHFQKAGVPPEHVVECHGSIHSLQCLHRCRREWWPSDDLVPNVDESRCEWLGPLPECPACGALARPNILMFGDYGWIDTPYAARKTSLQAWLCGTERLVVVEIGAGTAIPSVRLFGEAAGRPIIRVNPGESAGREGFDVSLPMGALTALRELERRLAAASMPGFASPWVAVQHGACGRTADGHPRL
ncbi:MAG: SIR2 family NAD-dependent protein deacylase [Verrucomicrobiales bacterium]